MPDVIQFKNGNQIVNKYDASGRKLHSEYYTLLASLPVPLIAGQIVSSAYLNPNYSFINGSDYVGSVEYTFSNDGGDYQFDLDKVYNAEGYIIPIVGVPQYYYYRKDHTGDNREVWYANTNTTVQRTQYYASGLPWDVGIGASVQNRKYNGKEFIEMHGYDISDLGWRTLHHAKMRFDTFDPSAENDYPTSPYAFCNNNPVNRVDPDGREAISNSEFPQVFSPIDFENKRKSENLNNNNLFDEKKHVRTDNPKEESQGMGYITGENGDKKSENNASVVVPAALTFGEILKDGAITITVGSTALVTGVLGAVTGLLTGDTDSHKGDAVSEFSQHGWNNGKVSSEELEILKRKKDNGTITKQEAQKLKRHEKNTKERASRQSKEDKKK